MVGLDDIHDWRNGMLLLKPIEWAFNNSKLIFIQDVSGQWVAHLLDKSLEDGALITVMEEIDIKVSCFYILILISNSYMVGPGKVQEGFELLKALREIPPKLV